MSARFKTILTAVEGVLFKEKGSKFISYLYSVEGEEEIRIRLESIRELHPKATHHCYAFRLGPDGTQYRANDDGEPSGTAGLPILNQLLSHEVTNVLCIVVRYYGGTKLGVSGLIKAYKESAKLALVQSEIIEKDVTIKIRLSASYTNQQKVFAAVNKLNASILSTSMENGITITAEISEELKIKIPDILSGIQGVSVEILA